MIFDDFFPVIPGLNLEGVFKRGYSTLTVKFREAETLKEPLLNPSRPLSIVGNFYPLSSNMDSKS
jgi:hypothetical protein